MLSPSAGKTVLVHHHPFLSQGRPGRTFRGKVERVTPQYVTINFRVDDIPTRIDFSPLTGLSLRDPYVFFTLEP